MDRDELEKQILLMMEHLVEEGMDAEGARGMADALATGLASKPDAAVRRTLAAMSKIFAEHKTKN